ncbi:RelA/SpoT domain-containing protein [Methylobacterium isbiliense]|uniref:RelA/SpoT domain-containing protein n=1 Tax=Methylobacterium isbiliense TaxID=315478 RepID=A0ABQ4SJZ2_9HYPH|nr:RelA/SpoT domain-containing protein [Methylobacterium isbiliense]MDN3622521.1 RelA/SpoT domain-containing protein [Methylobacterium isbiliense]GJE02869.1 hypothetical protein GMJLKIPL_4818 [Methylobacterium isbiliense]
MEWAVPDYSRNQVDKAGFVLADPAASAAELAWAYVVINNWRSAHSYPLNTMQINLRGKIKRMGKSVLVAQRIKRLESIRAKIERNQTSTIQLSQMQDIGGCRAVLPSSIDVSKLVAAYKGSRFAHQLKGEKDYINSPKKDGYRCHHLIYQYFSTPKQNSAYDKLRIEIQIRSINQHAWATALEAVGIFTRQALKSNQGNDDWLRFFALTSSAIAVMERTPIVPETPSNQSELINEIAHLCNKLQVFDVLEAYGRTILHVTGAETKFAKYYLVNLSLQDNTISVNRFRIDQSEIANIQYLEAEKKAQEGSGDQVVLVSVDSIKALRRAYPNYFSDTRRFTKLLRNILTKEDPSAWAVAS